MSRYVQRPGARGSLKWIQRAVNARPALLDAEILPALGGARSIAWLSPLTEDGFAEYRDAAFLARVGLSHLAADLDAFWPQRGPQWDALARSDRGDILLVEAKAHIGELCTPGTGAKPPSRERIDRALAAVVAFAGADPKAPWNDAFYQLANRFAHLHFLRAHGVAAWLVLVGFVGDADMKGPKSREEWDVAYRVALHVMGLSQRSRLLRHVIQVCPDVTALG